VSHAYPGPDSWDSPEPPRGPWRGRLTRWWKHTWSRFTSRFRRTWVEDPFPPPIKMPTLLDVHEPSEEFSFETPALGDAFNFRVRVRCSWNVQATASEEETEERIAGIRQFIEKSRALTRDRIEERVRPVARSFPPYRAAEAEKALNDTVSDCLNDGDVRVTVRVWVDVADPVREDLQKVWHDRLIAHSGRELETDLKKAQVQLEGDLRKDHIKLLGELQDAWRKLLIAGLMGMGAVDEAKATWLAPYALKLAEDPENAAVYLKDVLERRVAHAEQLLADLGVLAIDDRVEAIEFAFQSQSALLRLLMYLGVPVPAQNGAAGGGADV
jgi:hypothetical protein